MVSSKGRGPKVVDIFKRTWEGLPVVDAKEPLRIIVKPEDVNDANPADPENCALSQACKRLYESEAVMFLRTTAYIDLPTPSGKRQVERFTLPRSVRAAIHLFDTTGMMPVGGITLSPPTPSNSFKGRAQRNATRTIKPRSTEERVSKNPRKDPLTLMGVRYGGGAASKMKRVKKIAPAAVA